MSGGELYACIDVGTTRVKLNMYDSGLVRRHSEDVVVPVGADGLQDAEELFRAVKHLVVRGRELGAKSAGLATYRASTVAWGKDGKPLTPVVTWTDRSVLQTYRGLGPHIRLLGKVPPFDLIISPSSPVMKFLRLRELKPSLPEGTMQWTIDAYLAYRLTGRFVSDATNACLTGIIDPRKMRPIGIVTSIFKLKMEVPQIVENTERIGSCDGVEINSLAADQQVASVAEGAVVRGTAKVTNGTGTFVDVPTEGFARRGDLIPLVLLKHGGKVWFGVEGYLPATGRAVDAIMAMGIINDYSELEDSGGAVMFIPALSGLQIPQAPSAKGETAGLELGSDKRAVLSGLLQSIAFHVRRVLEQSGERVGTLRANGGLSRSNELMGRTSAATGVPVERSADLEATSRGLAMLQLIALGKGSLDELAEVRGQTEVFSRKGGSEQEAEYQKWTRLIRSHRSSRTSFPAE